MMINGSSYDGGMDETRLEWEGEMDGLRENDEKVWKENSFLGS